MKKFTTLIVTALLVLVLAGCNESQMPESTDTDINSSTVTESNTEASYDVDEQEDYNSEPEVVEQTPLSPEEAILGTWTKMTGVSYTFEPDGHMSVSISGNYNSSAGTSLDGLEVQGLLGEIEDFGRVVRGGTWSYIGENDGKHMYELFYNGSDHYCLLEDGGPLGVILKSGIGDMSMLMR